MQFFRQLLSSALIISLFIPAIPVGAQTVTDPMAEQLSLRQIQKQAKKDMALLKDSYGQKTKDVLPAVLAFTPLLATPLDRVINSVIADILHHVQYSFDYTTPQEQLKLLSSLAEALDKRQYSQALTIFDRIQPTTWKKFISRSLTGLKVLTRICIISCSEK